MLYLCCASLCCSLEKPEDSDPQALSPRKLHERGEQMLKDAAPFCHVAMTRHGINKSMFQATYSEEDVEEGEYDVKLRTEWQKQ